ncbi:MAG: hypothetical protein Q8N99_08165 [Nanoarchaeota archaeon]|nr:hypothetical protein [Nanoarchaeota archaeon]
MEEQGTQRIKELINIVKAGKYFEPGFMMDDYGGYEYHFPVKKRREAIRELKRIAKYSSEEIKTWISRETGLSLSSSRRVLRYIKVGLLGLLIGIGAGKGCERYVYYRGIKEIEHNIAGYSLRNHREREVDLFKKKYLEKQFEKNVYYMAIGGLVGLVVSCAGSLIIQSELELYNIPNLPKSKVPGF